MMNDFTTCKNPIVVKFPATSPQTTMTLSVVVHIYEKQPAWNQSKTLIPSHGLVNTVSHYFSVVWPSAKYAYSSGTHFGKPTTQVQQNSKSALWHFTHSLLDFCSHKIIPFTICPSANSKSQIIGASSLGSTVSTHPYPPHTPSTHPHPPCTHILHAPTPSTHQYTTIIASAPLWQLGMPSYKT